MHIITTFTVELSYLKKKKEKTLSEVYAQLFIHISHKQLCVYQFSNTRANFLSSAQRAFNATLNHINAATHIVTVIPNNHWSIKKKQQARCHSLHLTGTTP